MNTPPRVRSARAGVPPTPRHGAKFDSPPTKSRKQTPSTASSSSSSSFSTATLSPPPSSPLGPEPSLSPSEKTWKHRKRRASVLDEPVEKPVEVESEAWKELEKTFGKDFGTRSTVVNPGFGLPTPSKTPAKKKKHLSMEAIGCSSRRLFGSSRSTGAPVSSKNLFSSMPSKPRRDGLGRLGLMGEDDDSGSSISIFTDNNARIPRFDPSPENPFITTPAEAKKKAGRKGKKTEVANKLGDEGRRDDGMVYIFRGKKVFRKFAEMDEVEDPLPKRISKRPARPLSAFFDDEIEEMVVEVVEVEVEGVVVVEAQKKAKGGLDKEEPEQSEKEDYDEDYDEEEDEEIRAMLKKRSSIRPRLLFPSKIVEEDEPSEEEAGTDIEEIIQAEEITITSTAKKIDRSAISRLTPDSDSDFQPEKSSRRVKFQDDDLFGPGTVPNSTRKRSSIFKAREHSTPDKKKPSTVDEELGKPIKSVEKEGPPRETRKRTRGGSLDSPGLHTPRKGKKPRGIVA